MHPFRNTGTISGRMALIFANSIDGKNAFASSF